jgi:nucleotide-binding universal stress UspA family protein
MTTYKRIVCATDLSAASVLAVGQADELAKRLGATLHLLHVVQDPLLEPWSAEAYTMSVADLTQEWVRGADQDLAALAAKCSSTTITVCRVGRPVQQILEYVNDVNADLLVVGSHGHGFIAHMVLGSVADRLVRLAPCPVLTVRAAVHADRSASEPATSAAAHH